MTDFGLMFSEKYKTVDEGGAEHSDLKKQSQFASLQPEIYALGIRSTKLEIRNKMERC